MLQDKINLITSSRHHFIPSHILYADDVLIFCKGKLSSVHALKDLFIRYANCSGQYINPSKSTIYYGSISTGRLNHLVNLLGFKTGCLPFNYLGVPIFKGKPKSSYLQPIADRIKLKFSSWRAASLSIAGRILLVKFVIHSMLVHSISVYSWPSALLKDIDRWSKNFIWSGDVNKRKMVIVAGHKICKPYDQGGLGIRSLTTLNEATNLKLSWDMLNSSEPWAISLKSKAIKNRKPISHHIFSSIWSSVKNDYSKLVDNSTWLLGTSENIKFWLDSWCGEPLANRFNLPVNAATHLSSNVKDFISEYNWSIPTSVQIQFPQLQSILMKTTIPRVHIEDRLVWKDSSTGGLSLKDA